MVSKSLKILFIPKWYPDRMDHYKGIFVKRYVQAVSLKHNTAVLFVNADADLKSKTYESEFNMEEGIATVRVCYNNSLPNIPFFSSLIKSCRYLKACRIGIKIINEKFGIPDISHVQVLTRTFFPAYFYKLFYGIPYIITEHWSGYLPEDGAYKGLLKTMLTRFAVRKASAITTVSAGLKEAMISHGLENNYQVIPNVVDITFFHPAAQKKMKNKMTLLTVADMDNRAKNISGTIRVIKRLSEQRNDFEYHFIGDGKDRAQLEKLAMESGLLNTFIFFHGSKKPFEVAEMMRQSDLFILFSNYENLPCVMAESFASGLPMIGSSVYGMKEHIKPGLGILVTPGDENALLNAVQEAILNRNFFDKNALRKYAIDYFSYEAIAHQFDNIYSKVLSQ